jgi:hypothetical protein
MIYVWSDNWCRFVQVCTAHLLNLVKTQFLLHQVLQGPSVVHPHWQALFESKHIEWFNPMDDLETMM